MNPRHLKLLALLALTPSLAAAQDDSAKHPMEAMRLTKSVTLDSAGLLKASEGLYVKIRDSREGAYYAGGKFQGAGTLSGGYTGVVGGVGSGTEAKAVVVPGLRKMWYLEVLRDGETLCGLDEAFTRMACTKTDAVLKHKPQAQ